MAGAPLTIAPGATSWGMPLWAMAMAPSPILTWPLTPTCPPGLRVAYVGGSGESHLRAEQRVVADGAAMADVD